MNKEITQGHEARLKIKRGIDIAANAVRPTLGPIGMSAIIEYPGLDPIESDDGVTVLKHINLKDHYENMGVQKIRKAALATSEEVGDATATTATLSQALTHEAFKEVANDSSKIREVRERLKSGLKDVIEKLNRNKTETTSDDIEKIANVSSLDPEVSKLIAETIKEVGINGVVTIEKGAAIGYFKEIVKGARFDRGYISQFFVNEPDTNSIILEDVYIILVDRKISTNEQVLSLLNSIGTGKDILFIADDVDSVALATLTQNARMKVANIGCVRNPYTASRGRDFLFDIAALTGATVISEEMGMRLDDSTVTVCGRAEKVIVTKEKTTIIGGKSTEALQTRISTIENQINETTSEYEKNMLEDRLACLTGGIGIIRVGTYTDTEFNSKKYKFENAINATQAALAEGVVAGGGTALAKIGTQEPIFKNALIEPLKQMAINAGMEWSDVVATVRSNYHLPNQGFNFITKNSVDMIEEGIIDSFKSVRMALENATQVAYDSIGYEVAIVIEGSKNDDAK